MYTDVSMYTLGNTGKLDDDQLTLFSFFFLFFFLCVVFRKISDS